MNFIKGLLSVGTWGLLSCGSSPDAPVASGSIPAAEEPPVIAQAGTPTLADSISDKDFLMGKFDPVKHLDFVSVGKPYTNKAGMRLQKEAFEAFKKMYTAAQKEGIVLNIISSTRNFEQQKNIWDAKWARFAAAHPDPKERALKILEYSSMPGSSRHHWGTDIDINDLNNSTFEGNGTHAKVYEWLTKHAAEYNFGQPYTPIGPERPHGYFEEKWHWSYLPLAKKYRNRFLQHIHNSDIKGFQGAETAVNVQAVEHFVGGVSKACQ